MSVEPRKPFAIYAITKHGIEIARPLYEGLSGADLFVSKKLFDRAPQGAKELALPMGPGLAERFNAYDCHIFIVSVGAVVRMIAPLIRDKKVDPAVVCVDDGAQWSICLLSGHVGRGNFFTQRVAEQLGAEPIVTTASDVWGTLTVDILGRELGWKLADPDHNVTRGCAAVVNGASVLFVQETGEPDWWPLDKPLPEGVAYAESLDGVDPEAHEILLIASDRDVASTHPRHYANAVVYRPRSLVVGLGCDSNTPADLLERGVSRMLAEQGLSIDSVKQAATIDKKKDEPAIVELCRKYDWPLADYPAEELDVVPGIETPSEVVKKYVGTRAVAEPAALLAAGASKLLMAKQSYTEEGAGRSMTMALARIPFPKRTEQVEAAHV